jgi:hypothetical protein
MINSNVMRAVGEVLEAQDVKPRAGERLADTVARALNVSGEEAERWLETLDQGCTVEEANGRAGISGGGANESILSAFARAIGALAGRVKASTS